MITPDFVDWYIDNLFSLDGVEEKIREYTTGLREIFVKQGELVLYPDNNVTCFKYKNVTYFNPVFEKYAVNKIEINLRHLHPSLVPKLNQIEANFNDIGLNKRRMDAYIKRACTYFANYCFSELSFFNLQDHVAHVEHIFVIETFPNSFTVTTERYITHKEGLLRSIESKIGDSTLFKEFLDFIENQSNKFKETEDATIKSFNEFMFKTNILGF